jgi:hypothetical protein
VDSAGLHRRPLPPLARRLWHGLRRTLAACWPGWVNALRIALLLALVVLRIAGWLH